MVVDDVEDHLDPGSVQRVDHGAKFVHLGTGNSGEPWIRCEVRTRRVPPVVSHTPGADAGFGEGGVYGQQFHRRDADAREMFEDRRLGEPQVCAAKMLGHSRIAGCERSHVQLVEDGSVPGHLGARGTADVIVSCADDAEREVAERVARTGRTERVVLVGEQCRWVSEYSGHLARRWIEQNLRSVEPAAGVRVPPPVGAEAVSVTGPHSRDEGMSHSERAGGQLHPSFTAVRIDQAHLDSIGLGCMDCKLSASRQCSGTQWER